MNTYYIGGVPEHFNLPWYLCLRDKEFQEYGINLRWRDYPDGTGAMCEALREGTIDMAVILSEGIIRDIVKGSPSRIVQVFVSSPLIWGIHVAENAPYQTVNDLKGTHAAISRYGSGSHLMAFVNAEQRGWDLDKDLKFTVVNGLDGALESLPHGNGDYFMWEKFMTKPYVDNGHFRRIGECPTPWPCFVIAAREEFIESEPEVLHHILKVINNRTTSFKTLPGIDTMIANRYELQPKDVKQWLSLTEWSQKPMKEQEVATIQQQLFRLGIIEKMFPYTEIVSP